VLVVGAAGGMALLLAQLARAAGARVIGAARLAGAPRRAAAWAASRAPAAHHRLALFQRCRATL